MERVDFRVSPAGTVGTATVAVRADRRRVRAGWPVRLPDLAEFALLDEDVDRQARDRMLVSRVRGSFYSDLLEVELRTPTRAKLEPASEVVQRPQAAGGAGSVSVSVSGAQGASGLRARIIQVAESTLTSRTGFRRYSQPGASNLTDPTPATGRSDCSQWIAAVFHRAGAPFPGANTWEQARKGRRTSRPKPGDLMLSASVGHVELYVGGGRTIGHGDHPIDYATVAAWPGHFFVVLTAWTQAGAERVSALAPTANRLGRHPVQHPVSAVEQAIASGAMGGRLWFYANYQCNLRCSYCLTESGPTVPKRELPGQAMLNRADEAVEAGFTAFGVTGGEPFIRDDMPALVAELGRRRPTVVLSNATLFNERRLRELEPLADLPVHVQISLDHPDPVENDEMRGPENFRKVMQAIPKLVERGIGVRIATTLEDPDAVDPEERERLCELHRSLGIPDEDHVVRPIINRGRAATNDLGLLAGFEQLEPELTLTTDGAFYSPFGPTVRGGRLDTDLLVSRATAPLQRPVDALLRIAGQLPDGHDASIGIR